MHLDTRKVIAEVEKRPDLWDPSDNDYCFVEARMESWRDVSRSIFENFEEMDSETKAKIVHKVRKRWNTARTAYMKVQKYKRNKKAAKKPYVCTYYNRLVFLDKRTTNAKPKDVPTTNQNQIETQTQAISMIKQEEIDIKPDEDMVSEIQSETEKTVDEIETDTPTTPLDNGLRYQGEDDRAFLMSFLPILKKFSEDQKLNFRIDIMQLLIRIKNTSSSSTS